MGIIGLTGPTGTGFTDSTGPTGSGFTGSTGPQGVTGPIGPSGLIAGSWVINSGANTVSFTVEINSTYIMWIRSYA
jgi:hypothetical protein